MDCPFSLEDMEQFAQDSLEDDRGPGRNESEERKRGHPQQQQHRHEPYASPTSDSSARKKQKSSSVVVEEDRGRTGEGGGGGGLGEIDRQGRLQSPLSKLDGNLIANLDASQRRQSAPFSSGAASSLVVNLVEDQAVVTNENAGIGIETGDDGCDDEDGETQRQEPEIMTAGDLMRSQTISAASSFGEGDVDGEADAPTQDFKRHLPQSSTSKYKSKNLLRHSISGRKKMEAKSPKGKGRKSGGKGETKAELPAAAEIGNSIGNDEAYKLLHVFGLLGKDGNRDPRQQKRKQEDNNSIRLHSSSAACDKKKDIDPQQHMRYHHLAEQVSDDLSKRYGGVGGGDGGASTSGGGARRNLNQVDVLAGEPALCSEQQRAIEAVLTGRNVFITGGAGVGKSFIVKKMVEELKAKKFRKVQICASTGIAAVHIQGQTIHSFAGIPIDKESKESVAEKSYKRKRSREKWTQTDVLVIDEISMVSSDLFDMLDFIAKRCRGTEVNGRPLVHKSPMGGIQVIVVGDMFQLPPVENDNSFVFESAAWQKLDFVNIVLKRVWRQSDPTFVSMLNELRLGTVSEATINRLRQCNRPLDGSDGILPTKLYPFRKAVESENKRFFQKLEGKVRDYRCTDFASTTKAKAYLSRLQDLGVPAALETKPRMQVMLKSNIDIKNGLCNGSRGVILGYRPFQVWKKEFQNSHKDGIKFRYPNCATYLNQWGKDHPLLPYVLFANGMKVTIPPVTWERKFLEGKAVVTRMQIPLIPAWAITIHKSQGMSLDRVHMNLTNVFGSGMTYVALSRARNLEGLRVEGFSAKGVRTNPKVTKFYEDISQSSSGGGPEDVDLETKKPRKKEGMPFSPYLVDQVREVVKLNTQSAITQAMSGGIGSNCLDEIVEIFTNTARQACEQVVKEVMGQQHIPAKGKGKGVCDQGRLLPCPSSRSASNKACPPERKKDAPKRQEDIVKIDSDSDTEDYGGAGQPTQKYS